MMQRDRNQINRLEFDKMSHENFHPRKSSESVCRYRVDDKERPVSDFARISGLVGKEVHVGENRVGGRN